MGDVGLLLSLPTESIAVRVAIASMVAVAMARLLMHAGLRTARVRAALALVPGAAILVVLLAYGATPAPPSVWHTINASGGLTIPVRDTYLSFTPAALPLIAGLWAAIAASRLAVRLLRHRGAIAELRLLRDTGTPAPAAVEALVARHAAALRIAPPPVVVVDGLPGGAVAIGMREPTILLDDQLLAELDDVELAGVLAHELAHVLRRDNLVAFALCVLRDVLFFVPGGAWSLRMLLREREHAADTVAVEVTERPGALAGGLLKVLRGQRAEAQVACSPLLSEGTLVARVEALCDERPPVTRARRSGEGLVTVLAVISAVAAAAAVPTWVAGAEHQREALGVLLSDVATATGTDASVAGPSVVFRAFAGTTGAAATTPATAVGGDRPQPGLIEDVGDADLAGDIGLTACGRAMAVCRDQASTPRVSLPPQPIVRVDDAAVDTWRLEPIVRSENQENALFWWSRLQQVS